MAREIEGSHQGNLSEGLSEGHTHKKGIEAFPSLKLFVFFKSR